MKRVNRKNYIKVEIEFFEGSEPYIHEIKRKVIEIGENDESFKEEVWDEFTIDLDKINKKERSGGGKD